MTSKTTTKDLPKSWEKQILTRLRDGGVHLISSKGHGKSNSKMNIARHFIAEPQTKVVIFDTLPNWQHNFDKIPFFCVTDSMVQRKSKRYDLTQENYIVTEKDYYLSEEPLLILEQNRKALLFSIEIQQPQEIGIFISEILSYIYNKQRIKAKHRGTANLKTQYLFIIEEVENVFSTSTMERRAFQRIRKQYSEMANLKMACVSSSQRLQEVSTKFRGKMNYLVGRVSLEDYDLKLRRLLRHSKHQEDVLDLPLGCFLNVRTDKLIQFPKFKQHGKPYEIHIPQPKPQPQPQKRGFWQKLLGIQPQPIMIQPTEQTTEFCKFCSAPISEEEANRNEGCCDDCSMFDGEVDSEDY